MHGKQAEYTMRHGDLQLHPKRSTARLPRMSSCDVAWAEQAMTLIIATRTNSGEVVVAADRRTSIVNPDGDGVLVIDDDSEKLLEFDGAILGISGKYGAALRVVREFICTNKRDVRSCEALGKRLRDFYVEIYGSDGAQWPRVEVTYCDWLGERGRIVRLNSLGKFVPDEVDMNPHLSGMSHMAFPAFVIFGNGSGSVSHAIIYCVISLALTAEFDASVGSEFSVWILSKDGITKKNDDEIQRTLHSINASLKGLRQMIYPP